MKDPKTYKVLDLVPRTDQASKPAELIQITGHEQLTLNARRSITVLWHNAHRQGVSEGKRYTIPLSDLMPTRHKGYERVEDIVIALMTTLLTVRHSDGSTSRVQFLGGNNMTDPKRPAGVLTYNFDALLIEILQDSSIWGKISLPELMSLSSKYSVSLYEHVSQWFGLGLKSHQVMTLDDFRTLLGVEEGKYNLLGALNQKVLKPIVEDINAIAPFAVHLTPMKTGKKVTHIRIDWWSKDPDLMQEAWIEQDRIRLGRRARASKSVDKLVEDDDPSPKTI